MFKLRFDNLSMNENDDDDAIIHG